MSDAKIRLTAVDDTARGIASAKARLGGLARDAEAMGASFARIGAGIASALAVTGIGALVKNSAEALDRLNDLADATGGSIENLSALENTARRTGASFEVMQSALLKLNRALVDAKPGTDQEKVFQALGLSIAELRRQDPALMFASVANAMQRFADDGEKARAAQVLFGRSLADIAPLLKDVAERGLSAATVSAEAAEQADRFSKSLADLRTNVEDVARSIAADMLPAVNAVLDAFKDVGGGGSVVSGFGSAVRTVVEALSVLAANVAFVFKGVGREIGAVFAQIGALARLDVDGFHAISRAVKEDGERARRELDAFERRMLAHPVFTIVGEDFSNRGRGRNANFSPRPSLRLPGPPAKAERERDRKPSDSEALPQILRDALKMIEESDAQKIAEVRLQLQELLDIKSQGGQVPDEVFGRITERLVELDPAARRARDEIKRLQDLLAQTPSGKLAAVTEEVQFLNAQFAAGRIGDVNAWADAVRNATGRLGGVTEPLQEVSEFAKEASRNIQDALGDSLLQVMEGNTRNIGQLWVDMLKRMVAQALAADLAKKLFGGGVGAGGNTWGDGWIGQAIKWVGSNWGGTRAGGGDVLPGRAYLVGERGPEIVVPRASGTVLPAGAGVSGASYTINVLGDASASTLKLIRAAMAQQEARALVRGRY